jgi:hypothetical protein
MIPSTPFAEKNTFLRLRKKKKKFTFLFPGSFPGESRSALAGAPPRVLPQSLPTSPREFVSLEAASSHETHHRF